jgi:hypothetical protein
VDNLSVFFLAEGEQSADSIMARLVAFISAATQSLADTYGRYTDHLKSKYAD